MTRSVTEPALSRGSDGSWEIGGSGSAVVLEPVLVVRRPAPNPMAMESPATNTMGKDATRTACLFAGTMRAIVMPFRRCVHTRSVVRACRQRAGARLLFLEKLHLPFSYED